MAFNSIGPVKACPRANGFVARRLGGAMAIEMYTTSWCPYCVRAKALLQKKGQTVDEINIEEVDGARDLMVERSGGRMTVPQIFIDGHHVGGCDDLYALEAQGKLDALLG